MNSSDVLFDRPTLRQYQMTASPSLLRVHHTPLNQRTFHTWSHRLHSCLRLGLLVSSKIAMRNSFRTIIVRPVWTNPKWINLVRIVEDFQRIFHFLHRNQHILYYMLFLIHIDYGFSLSQLQKANFRGKAHPSRYRTIGWFANGMIISSSQNIDFVCR